MYLFVFKLWKIFQTSQKLREVHTEISTLITDQQQLLHFECLVSYTVHFVFIGRILPSKFKLFLKIRVCLQFKTNDVHQTNYK